MAIDIVDALAVLAPLPLLKALSMEVLAAGGFTPYEIFIKRHVEDADGAVAINGLMDTYIRLISVVQ